MCHIRQTCPPIFKMSLFKNYFDSDVSFYYIKFITIYSK